MIKNYDFVIGIDPGVATGFAIWSRSKKQLINLYTFKIHEAMEYLKMLHGINSKNNILARVEDARKRKWFGSNGINKQQGAGSIKRDCKIWEDFLTDLGIDFEMVAPGKNKTKWNDDLFKKVTGYEGRTSSHARDAAVLVFGL